MTNPEVERHKIVCSEADGYINKNDLFLVTVNQTDIFIVFIS